MEKSIINSEIVMVPSIYAKDKIVELLKINKDKVEVNYLGIDQNFIDNKKSNYYLKNFNYQNNYILSVLSCARYHNILNLLSAFKKFKLENNTDIKLVLVLSILDGGYYMKIKNFLNMNFDKNEIIILSNIENYYLVNLYRHSKLYIFTSYNEVFGFTSLEAMSQETPVLVSKNSALTEVNRDAVEYFDPDNILQIKDKIKQLVFDETIKKELVNKGKIHFKKFNWNNHIKNFLKLI